MSIRMTGLLAATVPAAVVTLAGGCFFGAFIQEPRAVDPLPGVSKTLFVPGEVSERGWEAIVEVLHAYHFNIEHEHRLDGTIRTGYLTGAGVLEPWHHDSVSAADRLESTFQPIRRKVTVRLTPGEGGYTVAVEAIKEREDPREPTRNSPGAATFPENRPLQRDLEVVLTDSTPPGWISLGRDANLEQALLSAIARQLGQ